MSVKSISMCLMCAGALLASCGNSEKKVEATEDAGKTAAIDVKKDKDSCNAADGYVWCEVQKDCIRLYEKGMRMNAMDQSGKAVYLVLSPDSLRVELFFKEEGVPNEILDRRKLPSGKYVWDVKGNDTKKVSLHDRTWTLRQRSKPLYEHVVKSEFEEKMDQLIREEERRMRRHNGYR